MAVGVLGGRRGTMSVALYIILGAVGVPVFCGNDRGIGILTGTTGGYIGVRGRVRKMGHLLPGGTAASLKATMAAAASQPGVLDLLKNLLAHARV